MNHTIVLLEPDGYLLLFGWVFAEQAGLPLPSAPGLIAAGVLAGFGHLNWAIAIAVALLAAVSGDSIWFALGRTHGERVTRIALENIVPIVTYNLHVESRSDDDLRLAQLNEVLHDAATYELGRVVIVAGGTRPRLIPRHGAHGPCGYYSPSPLARSRTSY
jgi:hypothetical protein